MDMMINFSVIVFRINFCKRFERVSRQSKKQGGARRKAVELPLGPPFDPKDTRESLFELINWKDYKPGSQEDAQQFLFALLDILHEETRTGNTSRK